MMWRGVLCLCLVLGLGAPAAPEYARPEDHGGLRDIALIYRARAPRTVEELLPLVAYVDRAGQPNAWFFDGFLFLTQQPEWSRPKSYEHLSGWLDAIFGERGLLPVLQQAMASAEARLGPPPAPRQVILSIPRPQGTSAARLSLVKWLVDEAIRRWQEASPKNLQLWGMYWYWEDVAGADRSLARDACAVVHQRGLKMLWIPYYRAAGWEQWREIGFDLAIMQPNYAFLPLHEGRHLPDESRLAETARLAREAGMGVEIETAYALTTSEIDRANLRLYLNHSLEDGYANAVRAHFFSFDQYQRLAVSPLPEARQLYDDLFALARGRLVERSVSLLGNAPVRHIRAGTDVANAASLIGASGVGMGAGDYIEVTLDSPRILSEMRLCLAAEGDGIGLRSLSIYGRETAEGPWRMLQSLAEAPPTEGSWLIAGWSPQMLSALRVVPDPFPGKRVTITRLAAYPGVSSATSPDNLAFGRSYTVRPAPESHYPDREAELTDGILTRQGFVDGHTVGWSGAPRVTVEVALPEETSVEAVRCHVQGGGYAAVHFPRALSVAISNDGKQWRLLSDSRARIEPAPVDPGVPQEISLRWLRQDGPPGGLPARWVRLTLLPAGWLMLSEVEVLSGGRNVARGQPYRLRPLPTAKGNYPDDGIKLTDGVAAPLWAGSVGWNGVEGDVEVDLGCLCRVRAIRAYVLGGGAGAVFLPRDIRVSLSTDGRAWTPPVAATLPRPEEKEHTLGVWALAEVNPQKARYVRLHLRPTRGWMMLGEVEVLGTRP